MLLNSIISNPITLTQFLICSACSLVFGLITALLYRFRAKVSAGLVAALVLLPMVVQTVILLVNGNLGIGVAVAGAFSLVRFRSVPGSAKEITALFTAMAIGLATGTGYIALAAIFTLIVSVVSIIMTLCRFAETKNFEQQLKITVPESIDYNELFDDILSRYTKEFELINVKTTNMGSLYELYYSIVLVADVNPREFIDSLRTRNGNLKISLGREIKEKEML